MLSALRGKGGCIAGFCLEVHYTMLGGAQYYAMHSGVLLGGTWRYNCMLSAHRDSDGCIAGFCLEVHDVSRWASWPPRPRGRHPFHLHTLNHLLLLSTSTPNTDTDSDTDINTVAPNPPKGHILSRLHHMLNWDFQM